MLAPTNPTTGESLPGIKPLAPEVAGQVIDQVADDPDPYHQQNIKNNVILAIAKILLGRDVLVFSI